MPNELLIDWSGDAHLLSNARSGTRKTTFAGIPVEVEQEIGSTRSGKSPTGKPWQTLFKNEYGFIPHAAGLDGEDLDVFLGPNENAENAYIIRTKSPETNSTDEEKCVVGADSEHAAKEIFFNNYDSPAHFESIKTLPIAQFRNWLWEIQGRNFSPQPGAAGTFQVPGIVNNGRESTQPEPTPPNAEVHPSTSPRPAPASQPRPFFRLDERANPSVAGHPNPKPTIYCIRHCHTSDNGADDNPLSQKVRGSRDIEPDAQGLAEADRVAKEFEGVPVAKIYSSPKKRARIIAQAISKVTGADVEEDEGLTSWHRGDYEGRPLSEVLADIQNLADNPDEPAPNGESRNGFVNRYSDKLHQDMSEAETSRGAIVQVSHLSNLMSIPAVVTGDRDLLPFPSDKIRTAEMVVLTKKGDRWSWKKHVHLADSRLSPIDFDKHRAVFAMAVKRVSDLIVSYLPGMTLLASEAKKVGLTPELLIDSDIEDRVHQELAPVYKFGHTQVTEESLRATGEVPPPTSGPAEFSASSDSIRGIAAGTAFNLARFVTSREMAEASTEPGEDEEYSLEAEMFNRILGTSPDVASKLAEDAVRLALCEGRMDAIKAANGRGLILGTRLVAGIPVAVFVDREDQRA